MPTDARRRKRKKRGRRSISCWDWLQTEDTGRVRTSLEPKGVALTDDEKPKNAGFNPYERTDHWLYGCLRRTTSRTDGMPLVRIPTRDLVEGMYVSKLDRPWIETPFLFQGFMIKSREEIKELQRYCRYVFVESYDSISRLRKSPERQGGTPISEGNGETLPDRLHKWMKTWLAAPTVSRSLCEDSVSVAAELPQAQRAYEHASVTLTDMMNHIREGGKLDIRTLDRVVQPMMESLLRNPDAMTWLSRIKQTDDYTFGHSVSCSIFAMAFGRHLGLPREDLQVLGLGGLLLDVGKTQIPKELLSKPESLTEYELETIRSHVAHGQRIVKEQGNVDGRVLTMIRSHHERYDGSGYPDGMRGPETHVFARIAGIVDSYDALITPRPYAPAVSCFEASRELHKRTDTEFQAEMVEQFIQAIGVFPNGALVELSSGEVGIVIAQNRVRRLRPKLMVMLDRDKQPLPAPKALDLHNVPSEPKDPSAVWIDRELQMAPYGIDPADYFL